MSDNECSVDHAANEPWRCPACAWQQAIAMWSEAGDELMWPARMMKAHMDLSLALDREDLQRVIAAAEAVEKIAPTIDRVYALTDDPIQATGPVTCDCCEPPEYLGADDVQAVADAAERLRDAHAHANAVLSAVAKKALKALSLPMFGSDEPSQPQIELRALPSARRSTLLRSIIATWPEVPRNNPAAWAMFGIAFRHDAPPADYKGWRDLVAAYSTELKRAGAMPAPSVGNGPRRRVCQR